MAQMNRIPVAQPDSTEIGVPTNPRVSRPCAVRDLSLSTRRVSLEKRPEPRHDNAHCDGVRTSWSTEFPKNSETLRWMRQHFSPFGPHAPVPCTTLRGGRTVPNPRGSALAGGEKSPGSAGVLAVSVAGARPRGSRPGGHHLGVSGLEDAPCGGTASRITAPRSSLSTRIANRSTPCRSGVFTDT